MWIFYFTYKIHTWKLGIFSSGMFITVWSTVVSKCERVSIPDGCGCTVVNNKDLHVDTSL